MKTADIREKFLQFFEEKGHARVPSSSLAPRDDPTLLFINSGMAQFKDVFLGYDKRPYQTAATAQRCLRAGGKHNDLENVGYTARHHTFFEMLGNFSFGDYFKEKAIPYAWEFLTSPNWLGLRKEHLWVTVFGGGQVFGENSARVAADDEAAALWEKTLIGAGFSATEAKRRISRIPTTDNFWMMGETGPCGPCAEVYYDKDAEATRFRGADEAHADECVEIWNLVFMQHNRDDNGTLHPLPAPCIDTGMGLERIAAVMQGVDGNYDIDLFRELLAKVDAAIKGAGRYSPSHRVIADHIRAAAFLVADGVRPGNEGRGYVLRKIIRRALMHGVKANEKLGLGHEPWFCGLAEELAPIMGEAGDVLSNKIGEIYGVLEQEEKGFFRNFAQGNKRLTEAMAKIEKENWKAISSPEGKGPDSINASPLVFPGKVMFELYDTYGFPPEATRDFIRDKKWLVIDEAGFEKCMAEQQERSRAAMKFNVGQKTVDYGGAATEFTGRERLEDEATIVALLADGEEAKEAKAGDEVLIVLDRTPFYAESGGQVGDSGSIVIGNGAAAAAVRDAQKIRADVWGHLARIEKGAIRVGDAARCAVDAARRRAICRNHSAAHVMHAALRRVLGRHVEQRGSQVSEKGVRFDFSHPAAVRADELREVEALVNQQIAENAAVETEEMTYDDALKTGAMALFGEKYGDWVRVVSIDRAFSVELCGGTHARRAGDIGFFLFTGESAIAAGVRRVEAVTADAAVARAQTMGARLADAAASLKTPPERLEEKIAQMREELKAAQKQAEELLAARAEAQTAALAAEAAETSAAGERFLVARVEDADGKALRALAMRLRARLGEKAAVLLAADGGGGKAAFVALAGGDVNAKEWLADAAAVAGAKGGGKHDMAQAGGGDSGKIDDALRAAREYLRR